MFLSPLTHEVEPARRPQGSDQHSAAKIEISAHKIEVTIMRIFFAVGIDVHVSVRKKHRFVHGRLSAESCPLPFVAMCGGVILAVRFGFDDQSANAALFALKEQHAANQPCSYLIDATIKKLCLNGLAKGISVIHLSSPASGNA
jgi:hypothetical protein